MRREKDHGSQERLAAIERELAELNQERSALRAHWQVEKSLIQDICQMKEEIETAKLEADSKEQEGDLTRVAELRYGVITALEKKVKEASDGLASVQKDRKMLKEEVDPDDIAEIVARWTGIPVTRMLESDRTRLLP